MRPSADQHDNFLVSKVNEYYNAHSRPILLSDLGTEGPDPVDLGGLEPHDRQLGAGVPPLADVLEQMLGAARRRGRRPR